MPAGSVGEWTVQRNQLNSVFPLEAACHRSRQIGTAVRESKTTKAA